MPNLPRVHRTAPLKESHTKHQKVQQASMRAKRRLYATNHPVWRRLRAEQLRREPLCRECKRLGKIVPANEVDHIDGDDSNNDESNLQSLCKSCHSRKTAREMAYGSISKSQLKRLKHQIKDDDELEAYLQRMRQGENDTT